MTESIPTGTSSYRLADPRPGPAREIEVHIHKPLAFKPSALIGAPPVFPSGLINARTVALLNEAWFRKAPRRRTGEIQTIGQFFHPVYPRSQHRLCQVHACVLSYPRQGPRSVSSASRDIPGAMPSNHNDSGRAHGVLRPIRGAARRKHYRN